MIGILGGMGTQAGLDFCNKLAKINRGKLDQQYPLFILYNKSDTPKRPEKKINIPIVSMPKEVFLDAKKTCKKNSKIGLLSTEATLETKVYHKHFDKDFQLVSPINSLQKTSVNKSIKYVKMGKIKEAEKAIRPAVNYLMKIKCKKIILGCTELPIAIFAFKSFKKIKQSKIFIDPNLLLANVSMKKYKNLK